MQLVGWIVKQDATERWRGGNGRTRPCIQSFMKHGIVEHEHNLVGQKDAWQRGISPCAIVLREKGRAQIWPRRRCL